MPTTNVAVLVAAISAAIVVLLLVVAVGPGDRERSRALARLAPQGIGQAESRQPEGSRRLARWARRLSPTAALRLLDKWHAAAGRPAAWPMDRVLATKLILGAMGIALALIIVSAALTPRNVAVGIGTVGLLWFLPDILLYNTGVKRKAAIERQLPDVLDQLSIAVEAGLGFEGGLSHVARHTEGPLPEEIVRTLQDMRVGVPRREAYMDLAARAGVTDLRRFVRAIVQAEQRGVSIAKVLQVQASEMRQKRGQRAEESAMQIPVKVIFPLMFCILPALFVVILGPAIINMMENFPR